MAGGPAPPPETNTPGTSRRLWIVAAVILVILLLAVEAAYLSSQPLTGPSSMELGGTIYFGSTPRFDPLNCLFAGQQTGWKGYVDYLGVIMMNEEKLDVVVQDGSVIAGDAVLRSCQSVTKSFSVPGQFGREMLILNRFNQIWYKTQPIQ